MGAVNLLGNKRIDADFVPNKRIVLFLHGQKLNLKPGPYIQKSGSLNECLGHLYEKLQMKMGPFL